MFNMNFQNTEAKLRCRNAETLKVQYAKRKRVNVLQ